MNKYIDLAISGEAEVSLENEFDLVEIMDEELSENELLEYIRYRKPKWLEEDLAISLQTTTNEILNFLSTRDDFLKELIFLIHHGDLDRDEVLKELNR